MLILYSLDICSRKSSNIDTCTNILLQIYNKDHLVIFNYTGQTIEMYIRIYITRKTL